MQNDMRLTILLLTLSSILPAQPTIKTGGIVNVSGYQATLAPGTVFAIFGRNKTLRTPRPPSPPPRPRTIPPL